jgi:hypothetical protein
MRNELEGIVPSSMLNEGKSNYYAQMKYNTMINKFDTYLPAIELRTLV